MDKRPTTMLLADHKTMFREGLAELLTSYGASELVGETTNIQGALARRMKLDMVIIQVQMPFEKTKEAFDRICAVEPPPKVAIVAMFEDPAPMRTFLRLGPLATSSRTLHRGSSSARFAPRSSSKSRPPLIDVSRSRVFDQAENRLHAWKALLYLLLG